MNLLVLFLVILLRIAPIWTDPSPLDTDFEAPDNGGWTEGNSPAVVPVGTSWFRANGSTLQIDPGHDHSCSVRTFIPFNPINGNVPLKKCGTWLSTRKPTSFTGTQNFYLKSPQLPVTTGPSCFKFWYHFFGLSSTEEKAKFEVQISNQGSTFPRSIWAKLSPQSNNWVQGYVNIPAQPQAFNIFFHAEIISKFHDVVGVDDVSFVPGPCPPTPNCDLESDLCSWTVSGPGALANGSIRSMEGDHTVGNNLGHYILAQSPGQKVVLSAPLKNLTSIFTNNYYSYCLKFWYFFGYVRATQDDNSYIEVNVTTYPGYSSYYKILNIVDAFGDGLVNQWKPFYSRVPNARNNIGHDHDNAQITITLYSSMSSSTIAIDDLLLQDKQCESLGECDFESDFCGWSNNGDSQWLRSQGGNTNGMKKTPTTDTTTHSASGWFAMIPVEYLTTNYYATLQSPPLKANGNDDCFSFSYYAVGTDSQTPILTVQISDLTKYGKIVQTFTVNTSTTSYWHHFHHDLTKMPARYSISIMTNYNARKLNSDIAIDDIELASEDCDNDNPWKPTSTTPLPWREHKWDCSFESSCTEWTFDSNWQRTSYRKVDPTINAPRNDKSLNTPDGKYMLWMPPMPMDVNQTQIVSTINSSSLSTTNRIHCLSFWYFDSSENFFQLDIRVKMSGFTLQPRSLRPNIATRSWKLVKVDIRSYDSDAHIELKFMTASTLKGMFAIDAIKVVPGECGHIDDFIYTMDTFDNIEMNRISPLKVGIGGLHFYTSTLYPKAPQRDHTTGTGGYFLFMNRQTDAKLPYREELVVNDLPSMRPGRGSVKSRCFRFAYQVSGNASLNVYISSINANTYYSPKFTSYGEHTQWVMAQVPYLAFYEHKLVFELAKPFDLTSYIAIDDISISSKNCKLAVECDFDDDVCSYSSRYSKADYDFARFVGPPVDPKWPGPAYDHTKRGYGGGYLYMTGYPSKRDVTRYSSVQTPIESYRYTVYGNYCVSFFSQITAPDATLTVTLGLYGGQDPDNKNQIPGTSKTLLKKLLVLSGLSENKWTRHYVEIDKSTMDTFHEYNLLILAKTTKSKTVVAIDDIQLDKNGCDYALQFKCDSGEQVATDKLCDFKKDCKDGSDEKGCGECNFENDSCGWFNQTNDAVSTSIYNSYEGGWVPTAASSGRGPSTDGSGNANGHYLLLGKRYSSSSATFIANTGLTRAYQNYKRQFKDAYFTCTISFDYYVDSNRKQYPGSTLKVRVGADEDSAVLKTYLHTMTNSWQKGLVHVGAFTGPFIVQFVGSKYFVNETVAIDNIKFNDCGLPDPIAPNANCPSSSEIMCANTRICIDPGDLCDFEDNCGDNWDESYSQCQAKVDPKVAPMCAFEKSIESCGFSTEIPIENATAFNWQYNKGYDYTLIQYGGPAADHTTKDTNGQYLSLRTYQNNNVGKPVKLYSPMMTSSGGDCLMRFFYFNNGNVSAPTYNTLKVWAQYADGNKKDTDSLFTSNTYKAGWSKGKVKLDSDSAFQFVFEGKLGDSHSSVSLDDVSFSGTCMLSDTKRTAGTHSGAAVTIILIFLFVGLAAGLGFFAYRKHQSGELVPFVQRLIPSRGDKGAQQAFVNANYDTKPGTSEEDKPDE